ncbi:MAG: hypothetical protein SGJ09_00030 [Phycisphaerae bacterium]|nr:hypothetical protein [Phycisphaerae bacterium]
MRTLLRTVVIPILILAVAAFLTWESRRGAAAEAPLADVAAFVRTAMKDGAYGATDPILVTGLARAWPTGDVVIDVVRGDVAGADGSATHRATLFVDGEAKLLVRCRYDSDPLQRQIVGFTKMTVDR